MFKTALTALLAGIAIFQANAGNGVCLTPKGGLQPAFSPDGNQLVYVCETDEGSKKLFRLSLKKKKAKPVSIGISGTEPRRIIGTNKIVFFSDDPFPQIQLLNLNTGKSKVICPDTVPDGICSSLAGGRIAIPVKKDEKLKLFVYDIKKSTLTESGFTPSACSVSQDGKKIAVAFKYKGVDNFKVIETHSGKTFFQPKPMSSGGGMHPGGNHSPVFSSDGRFLAYVRANIQPLADVILVDLKTGKETKITTDSADNQAPVFSPNGRFIAYSSSRGGKYKVWIKELK
jgi:Tol biopolymer transport system component